MDFVLSLTLLTTGFTVASWFISRRFLHFYQQEEYDNLRFLRWWIKNRSFEKRATLLMWVFALALWLSESTAQISSLSLQRVILMSTILSASIAAVGASNRNYIVKKALVMTQRAKRILWISLAIQILLVIGISLSLHSTPIAPFYLLSITLIQSGILLAIPLTLTLANLCLAPLESSVQKRYLNEARTILARVKPEIIGITGSYGKTSFKHILAHILASHAPTLATPGSVNTLMGITRIIREQLRNDHAFFLVEMGAYGIGSIQRLCGLTPPKTAIVTSIGLAHMERFKSIDTVRQAKSELPRALPQEGIAILNGDDPQLRIMANELNRAVLFYGSNPEAGRLDCRLIEAVHTEKGIRCTVEYEEKTYSFEMPLFGKHQALNATGAFLTAMRLGVAPITAIASLQNISQIPHRLVVRQDASGITIIDDAYNSNPNGFESALEVLQSLEGKRKILITPGMVELGDQAEEAHRQIAISAARSCDWILLIAANRLHSFQEGLLKCGFSKDNLYTFATLKDAQTWLNPKLQTGDVVLYENDLPDLYETPVAFRLF